MNEKKIMDLYELLPALYRLRDAEQGYKLRALFEIISEQADILKRDIDGLWDDLFIETCKDWVIPYIGDLVANNPLHEVATRRRADVAKTIYYRRRKGTLPMLEELARDVTGWGAHAVPFFELLGWTQNLNHLRYKKAPNPTEKVDSPNPYSVDRVGSVNLRNINVLDLLNGPFDIVSHTVDVRAISRFKGWYNIRKIGFFLWRLRSYPVAGVTPRKASCGYGYHFSPLGNPSPLFNQPLPETSENGLSEEINVPGPIRPMAFHFKKDDYYEPSAIGPKGNYGCKRSIAIFRGAVAVPTEQIVCSDLSNWAEPPAGIVAIDVHRGRLAFSQGETVEDLIVCYNYGFSADTGSGPYERRDCLEMAEDGEWTAIVCKHGNLPGGPVYTVNTLEQALIDWANSSTANNLNAIITIVDSATYEERISIEIPDGKKLTIQAANGYRPHVRTLNDDVQPSFAYMKGNSGSRLSLNGLLVEGGIYLDGSFQEAVISHCTLVPGISLDEDGQPLYPDRPSVAVSESNRDLALEIDHCITGPLHLPEEMAELSVRDSIIDACNYVSIEGPEATDQFASNRYAISSGNIAPNSIVLPNNLLPIELPLSRWGESYEVLNFNGKDYFAGYLKGFLHSVSKEKKPEDGKCSRILQNNRSIQSIGYDGEGTYNLRLEEGYELALKSIEYNEIHLELSKDGKVVHSKKLQPLIPGFTIADQTYYYQPESGSSRNIITIAVHIRSIIGWNKGFGVLLVVDGVWQISDIPVFLHPIEFLAGPSARLERTSVLGSVHVKELALASEVVFTAPVVADRRQMGCVRFSFLPEDSRTPRRYRCQPDLALEREELELGRKLKDSEIEAIKKQTQPGFTSVRYGEPGYAQLGLACAEEIRTGAEDGSEMGAFCSLKQPQREDNLRIRLEEYLPFGLEAGFIYIT